MRGYEQFSALIAQCPELLILKRVDRLTARILFRQQAELLFAEQELEAFIAADEQEDPDVTTCYEKIRNSIGTSHDMVHLAKLDEVAEKLKKYRTTPEFGSNSAIADVLPQMKQFFEPTQSEH